jgi:hypothetical protein
MFGIIWEKWDKMGVLCACDLSPWLLSCVLVASRAAGVSGCTSAGGSLRSAAVHLWGGGYILPAPFFCILIFF